MGGVELRDRSTWSESNSASRGATQGHASARIRSHSEGGGAGRDRPTWSKEQPSGPRCHSCGYLGAGTLVPCLRDINNKVAPPLSLLRHKSGPSSEVAFHLCGLLRRGKPSSRHKGGPSSRWHFTYVASSDAANPALGGITTDCSPPGAAIPSRAGLHPRWHFTYVASSDAANPALGIRAGLRRGGLSLMWPPPTRQTQPSAASGPIAHPLVRQSSQGLRGAFVRGGISLMSPPPTRQTHST